MNEMIVFDNVTLRYHYDEFDLLKGASFTLQEGVNTILADVQSGKSSICKLLLKDIAPTSGRILVDGRDIASITNSNLDILYLPRKPVFFENRSVQYNMEYPLKIRKVGKLERKTTVSELAKQFGIDLSAKVRKLNEQQRRTLALARGLTVKRKTALFDGYFDGDAPDFDYIDSIFKHFDNCILLTADARYAMGHTVVLDGGFAVYEGNATEAQEQVDKLHWLATQHL